MFFMVVLNEDLVGKILMWRGNLFYNFIDEGRKLFIKVVVFIWGIINLKLFWCFSE